MIRRGSLLLLATTALLAPAPGVGATTSDVAFTIAGVESTTATAPLVCTLGRDCSPERPWIATNRRLSATCLAQLADRTILVCQDSELLALGHDGRIDRWLPAGTSVALGELIDADVAPDGSVVVLGREGVARVDAGVIRRLTPLLDEDGALGEKPFGSAISARPGGDVVLAGVEGVAGQFGPMALARLSDDGRLTVLRRKLLAGPRAEYTSDSLDDVAALPGGALAVAVHGYQQVLRVDARGRQRRLAGGGRELADGERATRARLGAVTSIATRPDGTLLIAADAGLMQVDREGRIRRLVRGAAGETAPTEARALTTDGTHATSVVLAGVRRLEAIGERPILALVDGDFGSRVMSLAPPGQSGRLSVALTGRASLRDGIVDVIATRPSWAELLIVRGATVVRRVSARLRAGHNRVRIPVRPSPRAQFVAVTATDAAGAVATHRLAFLAGSSLSSAELHRVRREVERSTTDAVSSFSIAHCARSEPRAFSCRWRSVNEAWTVGGGATFRRLDNGLIRYAQADRRGRIRRVVLLEPR